MTPLKITVVLLLLLCSSLSLANAPLNSLNPSASAPINVDFDYFIDENSVHNDQTITRLDKSLWTRTKTGEASFGFNKSPFWIRLDAVNSTNSTQNFVMEIAYPILDDVTFYQISDEGRVRTLETGDGRPFKPRDIEHPSILFRFQLGTNEQAKFFARIKTEGSVILPVKIWQENHFFEKAAAEQKVHFFYYGALSFIVLLNLAVFFTLRERVYLFYALATSGFLLFFVTIRGYGLQLLFPDSPALNSQAFLSSMPILALFSLLFAREFLRTAHHSPKVDKAILAMIYFEYFNMVAAVVLDYNTAVKISAVSAMVLFAVLFVAGPVSWAAKRRSGIFFTIAWIPLTLGFATTAGRSSGALPHNFFTEYAMQIGSGLEAFILTLALAERLYREREKKITAQANSLETEKARLATQSQLAEAMMRDPITQLPNRNRFEWLANKMFLENPDKQYAVGVARITRIDEITRTLGLDSTEQVLKKLSERIKQKANEIPGVAYVINTDNEKEAIFQLSGDTFGILIERIEEKEDQTDLYHSFFENLSSTIVFDSLTIELAPRFGAALYPAHGQDPAKLIRNAHVAMENPKHAADKVGYYDVREDIYSESRLTLMADLKEALKQDEPTLHYQPKQDLKTGDIIGVEALIRWHHPRRGFVSPADFIPLAEETGVINDLTLWAFERAVKDLNKLRKEGYEGNVSINISARDLLRTNITRLLNDLLNQYMVDPKKIYLELTETAAMEDPEAGLKALNELTSIGLKLSIDDFGVGHSSLSYLKQLPASEMKLDRSLIQDMCSDESSRIIVKTSIDMGHSLGYKIVAEGVEDEETCLQLKQLNCDKLQGYWLCKPLPLEDLINWLKNEKH